MKEDISVKKVLKELEVHENYFYQCVQDVGQYAKLAFLGKGSRDSITK